MKRLALFLLLFLASPAAGQVWVLTGSTTQEIVFIGLDASGAVTPGFGSTGWTVAQDRGDGTPVTYTTPTVSEGISGVYALTLDELEALPVGQDTQSVVLKITHAGMADTYIPIVVYQFGAASFANNWLTAAMTHSDFIAEIQAASSILTDINDESVPPSRTWVPIANDSGVLADTNVKVVPVGGAGLTFAVDFREDLSTNDRVVIVSPPTIFSGTAGGVTFGTPGREDSQAKVRMTGVTSGTYVIEFDVTYFSGSTQTAHVTAKVP